MYLGKKKQNSKLSISLVLSEAFSSRYLQEMQRQLKAGFSGLGNNGDVLLPKTSGIKLLHPEYERSRQDFFFLCPVGSGSTSPNSQERVPPTRL